MKNCTKFAKSLTLALAITLGSSVVPTQKAEAGIIVIAATGGVLGPLIGLSMSATGFFWGIQTDDLNILAAGLFILDEKTNESDLKQILFTRYPELDSFIVDELVELALKKSDATSFNEAGLKEISLDQTELLPITSLIAETNQALAQQVLKDLTK